MAMERIGAQSIGPSVGSVHAIQGHDVRVNNSNINVVGGDQHQHAHAHAHSHAHTHTHIHHREITDKLKAILEAVSNYRKIQQDTLAKATPGTILWLFKCKEFRLFVDVDGTLKILWGSGMPGAGKTILASIVINELERLSKESNGQICVGYVYIRYSDQDQVTIRGILESLVKQIVERHPDCVALAQQVYDPHIREGTRPSEDELLQLLGQFTQRKKITFYVLDALDEAPPMVRLKLVQKLSSLGVRLFITSRPLPALEAKFPDVHPFHIAAQDHDLDLHINAKISESQELQDLLERGSPTLRENLILAVKKKCGGMFLHATLQLDALQHCFTAHDAMQTLNAFPEKIEEVYQQTWIRIVSPDSPHHASLAKAAFLWVMNAKQSMTIDLLRHALATCSETYHYDPARLMPEATIVAACRGLILVDKESKLARLVHYTAQEPLQRLLSSCFPHPHSLLTTVCITCLVDCGFQDFMEQDTYGESLDVLLEELRRDCLLNYAYGAWAFHAQKSIQLDPNTSGIKTFVVGCSRFPVLTKLYDIPPIDHLEPLHMAAFYDLPVAFAGLQVIHNPNIPTACLGWTPLHLACIQGHQAIAQSLLCLPNVLVNAGDINRTTPLMFASQAGHESIVAPLLTHPDIEVNVGDNKGWTALMFASLRGHTSIVRLLLTHPDIDVNKANQDCGSTALTLASWKGHPGAVGLLLAVPGINVNAVDEDGDTAIKLAAHAGRVGHEDIVHMLLDAPGIDTTIEGDKTLWRGLRTAVPFEIAARRQRLIQLVRDFEGRKATT